MQPTPTLIAASSLVALLSPGAFAAEDVALSFDLSQPDWAEAKTSPLAPPTASAPVTSAEPDAEHQPLPIPAHAANPPMRYHSPEQLPAGVYRRGVAVALNPSTSATALLPPAPPTPEPAVAVAPPVPAAPVDEPPVQKPIEAVALALNFDLAPSPAVLIAQAELARPRLPANPLPKLFEGDSDSLVAWAVGSAEGTRTPNGAINRAYFGHTDPGNRVWNMGTFSYQHGANTPEEADRKQLARLQNQAEVLRQRALQQGLNLTLEETLNGLDLANQSPLAAIGRVGYIERLVEAKRNGLEGTEAILVARTRSYINPNTGRWNAPGLGNTEASIRRDQKRRADMVAQAIAAYALQNPDFPAQAWVLEPAPEPTAVATAPPREPVDEIFTVWTAPSDPVIQAEPATQAAEAAAAATAAEIGAAEPGADSSPGDRLAALWQLTVDRLATPADLPQAAAIAGAFVPPPLAATPAAAPDVATATEPAAIASSAAPQPQSRAWTETREGSQDAQASATPAQGAIPESTVYGPSTTDPEPLATVSLPSGPEPAIAAEATPPPSTFPAPGDSVAVSPAASSAAALAGEDLSGAALVSEALVGETEAPGNRQTVTQPGASAEALGFARADSADLAAAAGPAPAGAPPDTMPEAPAAGSATANSSAAQPAEPSSSPAL